MTDACKTDIDKAIDAAAKEMAEYTAANLPEWEMNLAQDYKGTETMTHELYRETLAGHIMPVVDEMDMNWQGNADVLARLFDMAEAQLATLKRMVRGILSDDDNIGPRLYRCFKCDEPLRLATNWYCQNHGCIAWQLRDAVKE